MVFELKFWTGSRNKWAKVKQGARPRASLRLGLGEMSKGWPLWQLSTANQRGLSIRWSDVNNDEQAIELYSN